MLDGLPREALDEYRAATFRTRPAFRLTRVEEAVDFVNLRGFIHFWPIQGVLLPNLWSAVAGDRPVPDEHDDPGHITWGWKDDMLGKGVWYYARVLRRKNTMIALDVLPYFYALSPNYGEPAEDYLEQYEQGKLSMEAKTVYEALLNEGPLDTITLRKAARLSGTSSDGRFAKALDDLQVEFKILPVGVARVGAWHYAFMYDVVHRQFPNLVEDAGRIRENQARQTLLAAYFASLGAATSADAAKLFRWPLAQVEKTISALVTSRVLSVVRIETLPGYFAAHRNFVTSSNPSTQA